MNRIEETVTSLAQSVLPALGVMLWDVEFVKEAGDWRLRVFIDKPDGGVSLDDCEAVSRALDPLLDEHESVFPDGGYRFEVSSAGAERKLVRPDDFRRFIGHYAEIKLYAAKYGQRSHLGHLRAYDDDGTVTLETASGTFAFAKNEIANARLRLVI